MTYLLDTDICIYIMRQRPRQVFERFRQEGVGRVGISSISVAELSYGVAKSQRAAQNARVLDEFLYPLTVHAFDKPAAHAYGRLRALLERQGSSIGSHDLFIAAHALSLKATLVSNNISEFGRIPGLKLENWTEA
jgi:tRNA(fMet)-specific endonuclease VapC